MMNRWLPPMHGLLTLLLYTLNTIFWGSLLLLTAVLKLLTPKRSWRKPIDRLLNGIANSWVALNNLQMELTQKIRWEVQGLEGLRRDGYYLVLANHQSWVDILVLQKVFHGRIPLLKFFLKKELIWVPILGLAWWALDFPFMKRYSKAYLARHPERSGKDIEITRKACEKFKAIPISIMNFVEGTRYTCEKHRRQGSPYAHLLKPKAAGVAHVLSAMGEQLHRVLNVTIAYPQQSRGFWEFLCGRVREIRVQVESIPIDRELLGDYFHDMEFRQRFQAWLNERWMEKDLCIERLMRPSITSGQIGQL